MKNLHNLIGVPKNTTKTTKTTKPSRVQRPKRNKLREQAPEEIYSRTFHLHVSPRRAHTDAPNAMASPSLPNSNKSTKAIGGIREEEQSRRTPNSPRSRSRGFPSQREGFDWWKCRSRSPLSFPSRICKNHGRNQELGQASQSKQWRREMVREATRFWGRRRLFIALHKN